MNQFARVQQSNSVIPVLVSGTELLDLRSVIADITPETIASGVLHEFDVATLKPLTGEMQNNHSPHGEKENLQTGALPGSSATTSVVLTKRSGAASDAELIQRVLAGQDEAFRELVRPCEHAVFIATQCILWNEADAEDAAQEAVLKAFTNLVKFRGDSKFSTWLIRIATNDALLKLRKQRDQKLHDSLDEQRDGEERERPRLQPKSYRRKFSTSCSLLLRRLSDEALARQRTVSLDLEKVEFVDPRGVGLLRDLARRQVSQVNCSQFLSQQLKEAAQ